MNGNENNEMDETPPWFTKWSKMIDNKIDILNDKLNHLNSKFEDTSFNIDRFTDELSHLHHRLRLDQRDYTYFKRSKRPSSFAFHESEDQWKESTPLDQD